MCKPEQGYYGSRVKLAESKLKIDVASEGNYIKAGTEVVVLEVLDNFKNLFIAVVSMKCSVKLPYFDTNIERLV